MPDDTDPYDLPVAFHFAVAFTGKSPKITEGAFREVSGLESSFDTETVVEGGENRFVHQLPKPAKRGNIKLKRGLTRKDSALVKWCNDTLHRDLAKPIEPLGLVIDLLDMDGDPRASWTVHNAWPIKWSVDPFDAMKNELAIETVELAYSTLNRKL